MGNIPWHDPTQNWNPNSSDKLPEFQHLHCSSRYDRTAAEFEQDLDDWMKISSIITVTEVANDNRAAKLREQGWAYHNAKKNNGADNAAIAWKKSIWYNPWRATKKLHTNLYNYEGHPVTEYVHACAVVLKHLKTGTKMLVTCARLPPGLYAVDGWNETLAGWRARKAAYIECNVTWSAWTEQVRIQNNVDAIMVVGDWNLDLKANWVREFLITHWGERFHLTWNFFPTYGTGSANKVLDGTLAKHLRVDTVEGSSQREQGSAVILDNTHLHGVRRPYVEKLKVKPGHIAEDPTGADGDTYHGEEWWGFGDYEYDELNVILQLAEVITAGSPGGEVL